MNPRDPDKGLKYINLSELSAEDRKRLIDAMNNCEKGRRRLSKMASANKVLAPILAMGSTLRMTEDEYYFYLNDKKETP